MKYLLIVLLAISMNSFGESGFKLQAFDLVSGQNQTSTGLSLIYKDIHLTQQLLPDNGYVFSISFRSHIDFSLLQVGSYIGGTSSRYKHLISGKFGEDYSYYLQPYIRLNTGFIIKPEISALNNGIQLSFVLTE